MAAMAGRKAGGQSQEATGKFSGCVTGNGLSPVEFVEGVDMNHCIFA